MSKYLLVTIICLVVIGAGLGIYYFQKSSTEKQLEPLAIQEEQSEEKTKKDNLLVRDEYSILIPVGWREVAAPTGVSAMVSYIDEEITDPGAKKINFKTYYSIQYDVLQNKSLTEHAEIVKTQLKQALPEISFVNERSLIINGREAYNLETDLSQKGVDFKIPMVFIKGKADDVWTFIFNTPKSNWQKYQSLFQKIIQSFEVK
ncbi:hypothetical protein J7K86_02450 [bacterium]|nr:hypothetical protein [bacterium]